MIEKTLKLISKYRELLSYGIFGVLTTVVNYAAYIACMAAFDGKWANTASVGVSWAVAVLFAYFTNRKWVFASKAEGFADKLRECGAFFASRIFSGLADLGIMYAAVDIIGFNGKIVKLLSNVLVIIMNYVMSKFLIFKKRKTESAQ